MKRIHPVQTQFSAKNRLASESIGGWFGPHTHTSTVSRGLFTVFGHRIIVGKGRQVDRRHFTPSIPNRPEHGKHGKHAEQHENAEHLPWRNALEIRGAPQAHAKRVAENTRTTGTAKSSSRIASSRTRKRRAIRLVAIWCRKPLISNQK